jgi:hypothetical protein
MGIRFLEDELAGDFEASCPMELYAARRPSGLFLGFKFLDYTKRQRKPRHVRGFEFRNKGEPRGMNLAARGTGAAGGDAGLIADHFDDTTVIFADVVGFGKITARMKAYEIVACLNQ